MDYKNFSFKGAKGVFYQSFKDKVDGAIEVDTKEHGKRYHLETNTVSGILVGLELKEPTFGGLQLCINLEEGDHLNVIQTIVFDAKDDVDSWPREIAKYLPNLNLGDELHFSLNRSKKDAEGRLYKNLYLKKGEDKVDWAFERSEIPPLEKKTNRAGKETVDSSKRADFYYKIIKENVDRLAYQRNEPVTQEASTEDPELPF